MRLCECGCGELAPLAKTTDPRKGHVKGQPLRFVNGHNTRLRKGAANHAWKGGKPVIHPRGYVQVYIPADHCFAECRSPNGRVFEHDLVWAEDRGYWPPKRSEWAQAPGERLEIHHLNEDKTDNRIENLRLLTKSAHMRHHLREGGFA
jgi:HNH endonuclease